MEGAALAISVPCPQCQRVLPFASLTGEGATCPECDARVTVRIFPAASAARATVADSRPLRAESTCYFHEDRVAVYSCNRCGRFLCRLCRISWPGEDVCPACVEVAIEEPQYRDMESERFHWDSLALAVAVIPSLLVSPSVISAPVALGLALFTFRKPCSLVPRSKIRFVLAMAIAFAEIAGWIWVFSMMYRGSAGGRI